MIKCVLLDGTKIEIQSLKEINERGLEGCQNLRTLGCWKNNLRTLKGLEQCINLQKNNVFGLEQRNKVSGLEQSPL